MPKTRTTSGIAALSTAFVFTALAVAYATITAAESTTKTTDANTPSTLTTTPTHVTTTRAEAAPTTRSITLYGVTRSASRGTLAFGVGGRMIRRHVDVGDRVKTGQLIAELDADAYRNAAAAARATLAEINARLDQQNRDVARAQKLRATDAASEGELEQYTTGADTLIARKLAAEAQLAESERLVRESRLTARYDGQLTAVFTQPGEFVAAGAPIVAIAAQRGIEVELDAPESIAGSVKPGQTATVRLPLTGSDSGEPATCSGTVVAAGETSVGAGRLFPLLIAIGTDSAAMPGQTAEVTLEVPSPPAIVVPATSITNPGGQSPIVFLVNGSIATETPVRVTRIDGEMAVIEGAVKPGDAVVTRGHLLLLNGDTVTVQTESASAAAPPAPNTKNDIAR